jgi:hypothetical protein
MKIMVVSPPPPTPLRGCCRLLSSNIAEELHEMLIESPSLLLDKIGEWLAIYPDQPISTTALHNNLKDLGLAYKRLKRAAAEQDDAYCADWLHNMTSNYTADQLVFLDKSSKDDRVPSQVLYDRAIQGQLTIENASLNRGVWYSILPALKQLKAPLMGQSSLILFLMMS